MSTDSICCHAFGEEMSTTCTSRSAWMASSNVARKEATRWCGMSRTNPTVSLSSAWVGLRLLPVDRGSERFHRTVLVSSVAKSWSAVCCCAPVSLFISVLLTELV